IRFDKRGSPDIEHPRHKSLAGGWRADSGKKVDPHSSFAPKQRQPRKALKNIREERPLLDPSTSLCDLPSPHCFKSRCGQRVRRQESTALLLLAGAVHPPPASEQRPPVGLRYHPQSRFLWPPAECQSKVVGETQKSLGGRANSRRAFGLPPASWY